jgi:hypothetical protein
MKNGLFRIYLLFMIMSVALFSCENREVSQEANNGETMIQRKPDQRHPVEPNNDNQGKKGKKPHRKFYSPSSNLC